MSAAARQDAIGSIPGQAQRLGILMEQDQADPREAEGVLNPAAARGPSGQLYLLPRLVGHSNYSRIGLARVLFDRTGDPVGVERLGVVLEPDAPYEKSPRMCGVEDPRISVLGLGKPYVMTYTALGPDGARIAWAVSSDLLRWERLGLVRFAPFHGCDLSTLENKDAVLFPEPVHGPDGQPSLAMIHRPGVGMPHPEQATQGVTSAPLPPSMWISYAPLSDIHALGSITFGQHHVLAGPGQGWEQIKVGAGTPPVRVGGHWLLLYHGVSGAHPEDPEQQPGLRYSAGALLLDGCDPRQVLYRTPAPLLAPGSAAECAGVVPHVVFPTGLDLRQGGSLDVYYGMADTRIGVARLTLSTRRSHGDALAA